jgi:hypothetical protein
VKLTAILVEKVFLIKLYPSGWFGNAAYIRKDIVGGIGLVGLYASKYFSLGRFWLSVLEQRLANLVRES